MDAESRWPSAEAGGELPTAGPGDGRAEEERPLSLASEVPGTLKLTMRVFNKKINEQT